MPFYKGCLPHACCVVGIVAMDMDHKYPNVWSPGDFSDWLKLSIPVDRISFTRIYRVLPAVDGTSGDNDPIRRHGFGLRNAYKRITGRDCTPGD
jgi:hypothetical protein